MPNIWAHIRFGDEVLEAVLPGAVPDRKEWKNAFRFGCQGPDFLFYHRFFPWQKASALNRLGSLMHNEECGPFLLSLLEDIRTRPLDDPAVAFAIGFLLHHSLDRHLHPFVFSRSGFKKWHHQRFETAMDASLLRLRANLDTGRTPVAPEIDTGGKLPGNYAEGFLRVVSRHYPIIAAQMTSAQLDEAVADMSKAQKLFFDPSGWKGRLLFRQIEPFSPPRRQPDWDVLNEARQPWIDPCDRSIVHRESALALWDAALQDGIALTKASLAWLQASDEAEADICRAALAELLGNVSYETGKTCGSAWITFAESVVPA
jgi:hypothetical protein